MTQELNQELARWLKSEAERDLQEADLAFRSAFLHLPVPAVPAGFSRRVLSEVGLPVRSRRDLFSQPAWKWAFAALFAGVGILVGLLPVAASGLGLTIRTGQVINLFQAGLSAFVQVLAGGAGWLKEWLALPGMTIDAASSPVFLAIFFVLTLVSLVVLRWVTDLTLRGTGVAYVDAT
ncbi:MAG: hypothetical protein K0U98_14755 [Deltaproteobacteria bacterium]|nr:hypothetical protein [Deltaproteobacteria bacterium]